MFAAQYDEKLCNLLDTYDKLFLVHADNVGSKQFQDIRRVSQRMLYDLWLWSHDCTLMVKFSLACVVEYCLSYKLNAHAHWSSFSVPGILAASEDMY